MLKEEIFIPPILYKYRELSNEYHLKTLFEGQLFLATPYSFNDPFEGNNKTRWDKLTYQDCLDKNEELFKTLLKNLKPKEKKKKLIELTESKKFWHPSNLQIESKTQLDEWDKRIGLYCLSESSRNILMWSHYAENHKGFVIGFNTYKLQESKQFDFLKKITYSETFPEISGHDDLGTQFEKKFFYKSDLWKYEREWRLSKNHIKNRIINIDTNSIDEIIFGCKVDNETIDNTMNLITKSDLNVKCYKAEIIEGKFEINLNEIK